jgi:hypothetical protein
MDEPSELGRTGSWRVAVWSLRVGYVGLVIALAGLVLRVTGSDSWLLAAGVILWLVTVAVTLTGFVLTRKRLGEPKPTLWSMRMMLLHDSVHGVSPTR